ncbi:dTDP-4-dehydro-6-deoxyglucose reductase [Lacunisphaera limnophila]|uniref:dTDP-4-dehydro-6-deoxyglucose reductase n=1 Tax=Lacunisphaera limnophila TaxID=1838286 RepID=A0A1D8AVS1_9BACT|nr:NAD-dependent epimerase/dehydratase family protein [Lacunisphaera limnophila]AOS44982.1 dTDP-4-dehydro-6-deoxyglucose reductase [Lacunisphaera limnophila]
MKHSVVVTGASGFVGGALARALRSAGIAVVPVARSPGAGWRQLADYREAPPADVLVHLAEDNNRGRVNAGGAAASGAAIRTMEQLLAKPYRRVIYASSAVLYGDEESQPRGRGDAVQLADTYATTKWECERRVLQAKGNLVVRLANIYGPAMSANNVISTILGQIPGKGPLCVWDAGPVRDFLWIDDAVTALCAAITSEVDGVLNLGSGVGHSIGEVARIALAISGEADRPVQSTQPAGRSSRLVLDIQETTRALGWRPTTHLKTGVERLMNGRLSSE